MARFGSTQAFVIGAKKYKAGQTYADTSGNAIAGDVVWASVGLSSGMSHGLVPLDGTATTIYNGSVYVGKTTRIDGANSIG